MRVGIQDKRLAELLGISQGHANRMLRTTREVISACAKADLAGTIDMILQWRAEMPEAEQDLRERMMEGRADRSELRR